MVESSRRATATAHSGCIFHLIFFGCYFGLSIYRINSFIVTVNTSRVNLLLKQISIGQIPRPHNRGALYLGPVGTAWSCHINNETNKLVYSEGDRPTDLKDGFGSFSLVLMHFLPSGKRAGGAGLNKEMCQSRHRHKLS